MSNTLYSPEAEKQDAIGLIRLIYSNRRLLLTVAILSLALSIGVTFLMPNKYYSQGIVFATNSNQSGSILDNPQFGFEQDAEQLMQLLESEALRNDIVNEFKLVSYYEIDTAELDWEQQLVKNYAHDIKFSKTKNLSLSISATTKDPQLSADIVNSIIAKVNEYKKNVFEANRRQDYNYKRTTFEKQGQKVDSLTKKIYELKKPADANDLIYNHFLMTSKEYAPAETYTYINSPELELLIREYKFEHYRLEILKDENAKAEYLINRPAQKNYVIDAAKPRYKRTSPSLLLNCCVGVFCSLLFTIVFLFFRKKWREIMPLVRAA
ncbi:MAG TPA: Wzz/FepE/Etk N-terminal domain-containing protein [Bacteroidia bacterium]|nr:Wzz/FepE/Etk N-terminal domain-containing protein [Bacteroidia bacterium]